MTDIDSDEILSQQFASEMVRGLQKFQVYELGSADFLKQHRDLQRLNMQAHKNYAYEADEWVSELFNTHQKWDILIFNLITCYTFRTQFMKKLLERDYQGDCQIKASIFIYSIMFHEAVILDLLAVRAVDQLPNTKNLPELIDYLSARLDEAIINKYPVGGEPKTLVEELRQSETDLSFKCAIAAFSLIRGISCTKNELQAEFKIKKHRWHVKVAQILAQNERMFERTRTLSGETVFEHYEDGEWRQYEKASERHFRIQKTQGQLLIALIGLSTLQDEYSKAEAEVFEKLKAKINDAFVDQIPQLKQLRMFYEKICFSFLGQQDTTALNDYNKKLREQFGLEDQPERGDGVIVVDVVSQIYGQIEALNLKFATNKMGIKNNGGAFQKSSDENGVVVLSSDQNYKKLNQNEIVDVINDEIFGRISRFNVTTQTLENDYDKIFPTCTCGKIAKSRCSKCKAVWYCSRECQVLDWKEHKKKCASNTAKKEDNEIQQLLKKIEDSGQKVVYDE